MNMNLIAFVTTTPDIYHDCSTWKTLWEEKFTPVDMTSYGRRNFRKHRDINNFDKCIILVISYKIDCLDYREFKFS